MLVPLALALATVAQEVPGDQLFPQYPPLKPDPIAPILIVLADDLGVDMLSIYGVDTTSTDLPLTPNIDALAGKGMLFRNCWANPKCSPTRAALLSGSFACRNGIGNVMESGNVSYAPTAATPSLAEMVALYSKPSFGYTVAGFGKWHLEANPPFATCHPTQTVGFEAFAGHALQVNFSAPFGVCNWSKLTNTLVPLTCNEANSETYVVSETFAELGAWIAAQGPRWVGYCGVQAPYEVWHTPPVPHNQTLTAPQCTATQNNEYRASYVAAIEALDYELGLLLASLGPQWWKQVTIVFVGDNGTPNDPISTYWWPQRAKGSVYNGGVHVPLIVAGKHVRPSLRGGPARDELIQVSDIYATIADAVGASNALPTTAAPDSVSFYELMRARSYTPRTVLYAEKFASNFVPGVGTRPTKMDQTVRNAGSKLNRYTDSGGAVTEEFYDLSLTLFDPPAAAMDPASLSGALLAEYDLLKAELDAIEASCP